MEAHCLVGSAEDGEYGEYDAAVPAWGGLVDVGDREGEGKVPSCADGPGGDFPVWEDCWPGAS